MKTGAFVAGVFVAVGVATDVHRTVRRQVRLRRMRHETMGDEDGDEATM